MTREELKPGFYWARSKGESKFSIIVYIFGDSPFLQVSFWNPYKDIIIDRNFDDVFMLLENNFIKLDNPNDNRD